MADHQQPAALGCPFFPAQAKTSTRAAWCHWRHLRKKKASGFIRLHDRRDRLTCFFSNLDVIGGGERRRRGANAVHRACAGPPYDAARRAALSEGSMSPTAMSGRRSTSPRSTPACTIPAKFPDRWCWRL